MSTDQTRPLDTSRPLSIREAAVQAGVAEKTIRRWIKSSRLLAIKTGNQYQIDPTELARAAAEQGVDTRVDTVVDIAHAGQGRGLDTGRPVQDSEIPTDQTRPTHDQAPRLDTGQVSIDLGPLAGVIERQGDQIVALGEQLRAVTEAATAWQFRAMRAEEQLKQLTVGETAQDAPSDAPQAAGGPESARTGDHTPQSSQRSWWRRALGI
jgi:excisionase family DNA binding protein